MILGLAVHAGSYLLALPSLATETAPVEEDAARGPHAVGISSVTTDDAPISMTVWYPAHRPDTDVRPVTYPYAIHMLGPDSAVALATYEGHARPGAPADLVHGPFPLVVLSHGYGISSTSYAWLAEHLAAHGFVVIAPRHRESLDPAALWQATIQRPQDVLTVLSFVGDEVDPGGRFDGLVDAETVAVVGHSYGGYTALAAAGGRLDTTAFQGACATAYASDDPLAFQCDQLLPRVDDMAGLAGLDAVPATLWPSWADPRVDAVVSMAGDAAVFGRAGLAEVHVPVLAIGGTADRDAPFEWGTRPAYEHSTGNRKVEIALTDAEHLIFAGRCDTVRRIVRVAASSFCSDPAWRRDRAHRVVAHYTTTFLRAELQRDRRAARALAQAGQHPPGVAYRQHGYRSAGAHE